MLDSERGSIIKFFTNIYPAQVYLEKIPEDMEVPSMYFPAPISDGAVDSFSSYKNEYLMLVKIFGENSQKSYEASENIIEAIRKARYIIPVISEDGTLTGRFLRLESVKSRGIDDGVTQIEVSWKSRRMYQREESTKVSKINLNINL